MIDPVQLVVSVVGVSLIVGLVWLITGSKIASVGDAAEIRERLRREAPGFAVGTLVVDIAGRSALAQSSDGRELVLLFATGQRVTCWHMPASVIRRAELKPLGDGSASLELRTEDFTRGKLRLSLARMDAAQGLLPRLLAESLGPRA